MEKIKKFLFAFACITTFVVFASAVYITIFWKDAMLGVEILWQLLSVSFICCLGSFIYPSEELPKNQFLVRIIIQYIYINLVVMGSGLFFEWFYLDQMGMVMGMFLMIAIIFIIMTLLLTVKDQKEATKLNKKLEEYHERKKKDIDK